MRKLIIIRPGKHVGLGRTAGGRDKCQVAEFAVHGFSSVCTFTQASFDLGRTVLKQGRLRRSVSLIVPLLFRNNYF